MKELNKGEKQISRRNILPLLAGGLLIPLFGFGKSKNKIEDKPSDDDYQILLRKDGSTVKVKTATIKESRMLEKKLSNNSFLGWLKKNSKFI